MKLLFDENLGPRAARRLSELFPASSHVRDVGLNSASDREVWEFARIHDFVIVSKDGNFQQLSFLYGFPPKVVWIRRGNCTVEDIEDLLRTNAADLEAFGKDEEAALLILS